MKEAEVVHILAVTVVMTFANCFLEKKFINQPKNTDRNREKNQNFFTRLPLDK